MVQQTKMGGMELLRVCLKGNQDLIDALAPASPPGGGLASLVGDRSSGAMKAAVTIERGGRSDLWLQQFTATEVPVELRELGLVTPDVASQFTTSCIASGVHVVVFSVQPDAVELLWKHRRQGYLLQAPGEWEASMTPAQRAWFESSFDRSGPLGPRESAENYRRLIKAVKERTGAHIIFFNCSTYDPADNVHNYGKTSADTLTIRLHRLNLAIMQISQTEGISVMDVDRRIAELGAGQNVLAPASYSPAASQAIAEEFYAMLKDIGFFEKRPLVAQVGKK
jgi:hypothetical protein